MKAKPPPPPDPWPVWPEIRPGARARRMARRDDEQELRDLFAAVERSRVAGVLFVNRHGQIAGSLDEFRFH
jgi:hypothetical protein